MKFEFIPIDFDYFDFEGKNYIRLIGRTEKGEKICVIDNYEPNFWIILKKEYEKNVEKVCEKIKKTVSEKASRLSGVLRTEICNKKFLGKEVVAIQVFVTNHKDAHDIASKIGDMKEIEFRREYDIPILTKYIKEKKVEPLRWYTVDGNAISSNEFSKMSNTDLKICVYASKIEKSKKEGGFKPKILAYDIEVDDTEIGKGNILMVSLYGDNFRKCLTWKKCENSQDYVDCFENQAKMIEGFVKYVKEYDPDVLTGYFSDGFDLPYLKSIAKKNRLKLNLGIDDSEPIFSRGRISSGKIFGIVHIDLYRFIDAVFSQYLQSETLSLNEVAGELFGEKKENFDFEKLNSMKDSDWRDFFSYCLQDSRITYMLAEKIWPDIFEFTRIIKEPIFDVTRDRMSSHVENFIIHNLDRFNEIAEKRPVYDEIEQRKSLGKYEGAFVLQPIPGFYENLAVFDFTSMHASIIVSFNLSKSTLVDKKEKGSFQTPEFEFDGEKKFFYFSKEKGFTPKLLEEVVGLRKKYKKEYNENKNPLLKARSNAYKLLANASYGYLGFFGARYYSREAAASTLAFVRDFASRTIEKIRNEGYGIIFSDTDSIGFELKNKTKNQVLELLKKINSELPGIMELDLEDFYRRGLFVSKRTTKEGAKKKYALLDENNKLKIRGFETVRRDWCKLARDLQNEILKKILEDGDEKRAFELLKVAISKLKNRKINIRDLMIRTQLRREISQYLSEGPHVAAAKKMKEKEIPVSQGMLIEYFIGESKSKGKRIGDRVFLPNEKVNYDVDYYLNNQIIPAVENIFEVFGINIKNIIEGEEQRKLF
ncbi:MAG: DNA-directed DNA polymerase [Candidatus Pacearchaeota archaeon]